VTPTFQKFATREVRVPTFVDTATINNNSPAEIERDVHYGETETREFSWSLTTGVTVGATVAEKVSVPGLSGELTMTMQMSVSATAGRAWRDDKDWSTSTRVKVPRYSSVHVQAVLTRVAGDLPFVLKVVKDGRAKCQVTLSYHGQRVRAFEIPLPQLLGAAGRTFELRGKVSGACGTRCDIDAQGRPLALRSRTTLPEGVSSVPSSLGTLHL